MSKRLLKEAIETELSQICDPTLEPLRCFTKDLGNGCTVMLAFNESYPFTYPEVYLIKSHHNIQNKNIIVCQENKIQKNGNLWIDLFSHWSPVCTVKDIINEVTNVLDMAIKDEKDKYDTFLRQLYIRELVNIHFPYDILRLLVPLLE